VSFLFVYTGGAGGGGAGDESAPPKVSGKISENRKILENTVKNGAQRALIWKNGVQRVQNYMKTLFGGHPKNGLHENIFAQKVTQKFAGKFGEIRTKILRNPKNLPTRMAFIQQSGK